MKHEHINYNESTNPVRFAKHLFMNFSHKRRVNPREREKCVRIHLNFLYPAETMNQFVAIRWLAPWCLSIQLKCTFSVHVPIFCECNLCYNPVNSDNTKINEMTMVICIQMSSSSFLAIHLLYLFHAVRFYYNLLIF